MPSDDPADRLLDAHVAFALEQLAGPSRDDLVTSVVDELLAIGERLTLADVLDVDEVVRIVRRLLTTVPPSDGATRLSQAAPEVLHAGPSAPFAPADLIARDDVERVVDELVRAEPLVRRALDEIVDSPLVAGVVSRFVSRVVGDVVATNTAVAQKVPGLGGLMSLGAGAASKVVGAGEPLLGAATGKGAQLAARRVSKVAAETLKDPQLREALLELWDARSGRPVHGVASVASLDDVRRVVALVHDVAVGVESSAPFQDLVETLVRAVFATYGDTPVTTILAELAITRDDLVTDARALVAHAVDAALADGGLEPLVRARLEPFYRSPAFRAALGT